MGNEPLKADADERDKYSGFTTADIPIAHNQACVIEAGGEGIGAAH
jgi:hypothetical protein